jgi:hypothetical protein
MKSKCCVLTMFVSNEQKYEKAGNFIGFELIKNTGI